MFGAIRRARAASSHSERIDTHFISTLTCIVVRLSFFCISSSSDIESFSSSLREDDVVGDGVTGERAVFFFFATAFPFFFAMFPSSTRLPVLAFLGPLLDLPSDEVVGFRRLLLLDSAAEPRSLLWSQAQRKGECTN